VKVELFVLTGYCQCPDKGARTNSSNEEQGEILLMRKSNFTEVHFCQTVIVAPIHVLATDTCIVHVLVIGGNCG
jgi:hypothetical protein